MDIPVDPMTLLIIGVLLFIGAAVLKRVIRLIASLGGAAALILALTSSGIIPV